MPDPGDFAYHPPPPADNSNVATPDQMGAHLARWAERMKQNYAARQAARNAPPKDEP